MPFRRRRDADLGEDFVRLQGRRQEVEKELSRRNAPLTAGSSGDDGCVKGQDRRRIVGGRIGVGERSADRSPVANLPVANTRRGVREEGYRGSNLGVGRNLMMGDQGADRDLTVVTPHAAQFGDAADVDQQSPALPGATS